MEPVNDQGVLSVGAEISILRLRMEPVLNMTNINFQIQISILRLRMEPVCLYVICIKNLNNFYPQAPHGACQQKTPKICPIVIASFCNITNNMPIKNRFFTTLHILFSSFPVRISYEFHVHFTFAPENLIQYVNQFLFFLKFHQKLPVQAPQVHVQ